MTALLMERQAEQLAVEIRDAGVTQRGRRYPRALRERAVQLCSGLRQEGRMWSEISDLMGVSENSLRRWTESQDEPSTAPLRRVDVRTSPSEATTIALVSPSGWRVEGLSLVQIAELVR